MSLRSIVRGLVVVTAVLAAGRFWALANLDTSPMARAVVWLAPNGDDWKNRPSRSFAASRRPLALTTPAGPDPTIDQLEITGIPLPGFLASTDTTALLVARGETLIHEAYFNASHRSTTQTSFSLSQVFTATLIGLAIDDGLLDLDDPVGQYVPEFTQQDHRLAGVSLRHLITMSSGLRRKGWGLTLGDKALAYYAPDLRQAAMQQQFERPAGQVLQPHAFNSVLLGMVLERTSGQEIAQFLQQRLWQPMGSEAGGGWTLDSTASGFEQMSNGLNARAIDFLKLGILYAQDGRISGRQVISPAFVAEATRADTSLDPAAQYQFNWWILPDKGTYAAWGDKGQVLYIDPASDLVILRMGHSGAGIDRDGWFQIIDQIARALTKG